MMERFKTAADFRTELVRPAESDGNFHTMDESKNGMTRPFRLLIALLGGALVVGLAAYFWAVRGSADRETSTSAVFGGWVYRGQDQKKAGLTLAKAGLTEYRWEEGQLLVPSERRSEYEKALGENQALPQAPSDIKREALTEMNQFESESKTRLREQDAASRQLEATIEEFRQIESATVAVRTRSEQVGLSRKNITTASVGVMPKGDQPLSAELITAITQAVKHHFGIDDNANISIMDFRQGRSYTGNDQAVQRADFTSYTEEQSRQEELWREKLRNAFIHIPGLQVAATVDLAPLAADVGRTFDESSVTLANRGGGLVYRPAMLSDEEKPVFDAAAEEIAAEATPTDAETPRLSSLRYRPRSIAVSIAVPESYVRKMIGSNEDRSNDSAVFKAKSDEIVRYIRQMAETLLLPLDEKGGAPDSNLIRVSFYSDAADEAGNAADLPVKAETPAVDAEEGRSPAAPYWSGKEWLDALQKDRPGQIRAAGSLLFALAFGGALLYSIRRARRRRRSADDSPELISEESGIAAPLQSSERPTTEKKQTALNEIRSEDDSRRLRDSLVQSLEEEFFTESGGLDESPADFPNAPSEQTEEDDETEIIIDAAHSPSARPADERQTPEQKTAESESADANDPSLHFRFYDEKKGTTNDYRIESTEKANRTPHFVFTPPTVNQTAEKAANGKEASVSSGEPGDSEETLFFDSGYDSPSERGGVFETLGRFSPERLSRALRRESPQTAAAVLKYLPESASRAVLACWEPVSAEKMRERVRRTGPIDRDVLRTIERSLLAGEER